MHPIKEKCKFLLRCFRRANRTCVQGSVNQLSRVESLLLLIAQVVSEKTKIIDYRHKQAEYNGVEIPEY